MDDSYCFLLFKNEAVSKRHLTRNLDVSRFCCQNCMLNICLYHEIALSIFPCKLCLKGALSGLRQFLAAESPLKMMKNAFYFTSKALFVLKIFKFLSWLFGHVAKRLDKKDNVHFKFYDVTTWLTNNRDTHMARYFEK